VDKEGKTMRLRYFLFAFFLSSPLYAATTKITDTPVDIYKDYYQAKKHWSNDRVAKAELLQFVQANKEAIASQLKIETRQIDVEGPKVSDDGNICVRYFAVRTKLGDAKPKAVSEKLQKLAQEISTKNESPLSGSRVIAAHYPKTIEDASIENVELLTTCLSPDKF